MADGVLDLTKDRILKNVKELERIESLVDNLGELMRLESPEMKISPVLISTEAFFRELDTRFSPLFSQKSISVHWEKGIETFSADENLLLRAVSNFISNAIRHTPEKGRITISASRDGKSILFSVSNTGKGIPEEEIERVFDRLYRGDIARRSPGSGLGLTIAQKIAELHGGEVTLQSTETSGTTVKMRIKS
jgi:two-component system sensor histidine kinase BaeS